MISITLSIGRLFVDTFKKSENVVSRQIDEKTILVPINQTGVDVQKIYALNNTAAAAWELLETPKTLDQLVDALERDFTAGTGVIRNDIEGLIQDLLKIKFLDLIRK